MPPACAALVLNDFSQIFFIMAKDKYHIHVREALENDGWAITHDPLMIAYSTNDVETEPDVEKLIGAEKGERKIALKVKSFVEGLEVPTFYQVFGQYLVYQMTFDYHAIKDRELFLAASLHSYNTFLIKQQMVKDAIEKKGLNLIVVNMKTKQIVKWIKK